MICSFQSCCQSAKHQSAFHDVCSPWIQVSTQSVEVTVVFCSQQLQFGPLEAEHQKGGKFRHRCRFAGTKECRNFCPFPVALRHSVNLEESRGVDSTPFWWAFFFSKHCGAIPQFANTLLEAVSLRLCLVSTSTRESRLWICEGFFSTGKQKAVLTDRHSKKGCFATTRLSAGHDIQELFKGPCWSLFFRDNNWQFSLRFAFTD